jgi:3-oxoacyl-(acyl-carrier-protein) synthase
VLVLEDYEHARARGARIHAEFAGAGITADAHHVVQPDPSGLGCDLAASDNVHINAHTTATPAGDRPRHRHRTAPARRRRHRGLSNSFAFGGHNVVPALSSL